MDATYEKAFDKALFDLEELLRRRRETDGEISKLRDIILALYEKAGSDRARREKLMDSFAQIDVATPRLTDAAKDALYTAYPRKLPAIQVKELMEVRGFDFANFTNPLASVHSTLRRLAGQNEIASGSDRGVTVYSWKGSHWGARNSLANMLADRELLQKMNEKILERVNRSATKLGIRSQQ